MAKHNKSTKRKIRKRVRHNAKKIKELTAEEILLNPALVESPQFKQLPTEKQIQLMTQVRQLKTMFAGRTGGGVVSQSSGSADPALFARLNEANNKVSRQSNENEQLRIQLQAATDAYKREKELAKDIKRREQEQKDDIERKARIDDLTAQKQRLDIQAEDFEQRLLEQSIRNKKEQGHIKELQEKKKENIRLSTELNLLNQSINPNFSRFTTPHSEGKKRMRSELFNQSWNNNINTQHIYQNQINSFTENGNNNKAEAAERLLNSLSDDNDLYDDDDKKKKLVIDPLSVDEYDSNNDNDNIPVPPIESIEEEAIKAEVKLDKENQTRREEIEQLEALEKQKKIVTDKVAANIHDISTLSPFTTQLKIDFEKDKEQTLNQLNDVLARVENPSRKYKAKLTNKIYDAKTPQELRTIKKKLDLDKSNQEEFIKQNKILEDKKEECLNKLEESKKLNISSTISIQMWQHKLKYANTMDELLRVENMINLYNQSINILATDAIEQKQKSTDESTSKEAHARASAAVDNIMKVKNFLTTHEPRAKPKLFIDGDKEKEFSPGTRELRPNEDIEYIDVTQYVYDPDTCVIPNEILLNGVNLGNVIKRFGESSEKGKFFASLAWKMTCCVGRNTKKFVFYTVNVGTSILIAAVPKVIDIAVQNPTTFAAGLGGFAFYKWIKEKLFRTDAETLYNNKEKINTNNIIKVVKDTFTQKPKDKPPSPTNEDIAKLLEPRTLGMDFSYLDEEEENLEPQTEKKKKSWYKFWG